MCAVFCEHGAAKMKITAPSAVSVQKNGLGVSTLSFKLLCDCGEPKLVHGTKPQLFEDPNVYSNLWCHPTSIVFSSFSQFSFLPLQKQETSSKNCLSSYRAKRKRKHEGQRLHFCLFQASSDLLGSPVLSPAGMLVGIEILCGKQISSLIGYILPIQPMGNRVHKPLDFSMGGHFFPLRRITSTVHSRSSLPFRTRGKNPEMEGSLKSWEWKKNLQHNPMQVYLEVNPTVFSACIQCLFLSQQLSSNHLKKIKHRLQKIICQLQVTYRFYNLPNDLMEVMTVLWVNPPITVWGS